MPTPFTFSFFLDDTYMINFEVFSQVFTWQGCIRYRLCIVYLALVQFCLLGIFAWEASWDVRSPWYVLKPARTGALLPACKYAALVLWKLKIKVWTGKKKESLSVSIICDDYLVCGMRRRSKTQERKLNPIIIVTHAHTQARHKSLHRKFCFMLCVLLAA